MNTIIASIVGASFLLMFLFRILFALFYPEKFAEGARKVLFIDAREKALFPPEDKKQTSSKTTPNQTRHRTGIDPDPTGSECPKPLLNKKNVTVPQKFLF